VNRYTPDLWIAIPLVFESQRQEYEPPRRMLYWEESKMRQCRFAGFTLIELLVVIAIIAILAAILFPVFAQARDKARSSACLSNTKQIGTAIMMYTQDYDETLPEYWDDNAKPSNPNPLGYWHNHLQPYIKNYQVFICPSARSKDERTVDTGEGTPAQRISTLRWRGSGSYG
jgi:prepilin-type N-terminal cleavage/methylation domain-containing protein